MSEPASTDRRGCVGLALGVLLVLIGIPMLVCPGPGMASILAGGAMIAASLGLTKRGQDVPAPPE